LKRLGWLSLSARENSPSGWQSPAPEKTNEDCRWTT
jgi:hypothetical protein